MIPPLALRGDAETRGMQFNDQATAQLNDQATAQRAWRLVYRFRRP